MWNHIVAYTSKKFTSQGEAKEEMNLFLKQLKATWPNKYVKEVTGSYYLTLNEKLTSNDNKVLKLFPMIDLRSASEMIISFDRYFQDKFVEETRNQTFYHEPINKTKVTQEEEFQAFKRNLAFAINYVKDGRHYNLAGLDTHLYNELHKLGKIDVFKHEWDRLSRQATKALQSRYRAESYTPNTTLGKAKGWQKLASELIPESVAVGIEVKNIILNKYLKEYAKLNMTVEQVLEMKEFRNENDFAMFLIGIAEYEHLFGYGTEDKYTIAAKQIPIGKVELFFSFNNMEFANKIFDEKEYTKDKMAFFKSIQKFLEDFENDRANIEKQLEENEDLINN